MKKYKLHWWDIKFNKKSITVGCYSFKKQRIKEFIEGKIIKRRYCNHRLVKGTGKVKCVTYFPELKKYSSWRVSLSLYRKLKQWVKQP